MSAQLHYTANYSHSNHNFVIQNLGGERVESKYLPAICILKNILQRGKPTLMSTFLQEKIGAIHKNREVFEKPYPLIDNKEIPNWERVIRGDDKGNYYPAKKFYEEIPTYLREYAFIQQLIVPEVPINEITQVDVDDFAQQQVDFYLPQAYLIIEIDGSHHQEKKQKDKDDNRDDHLKRYGIQTIRIKTSDLEEENEIFHGKIKEIETRVKRAIESQKKRREEDDKTFISIDNYKTAFENGVNASNPHYRATAIIRFQILLLELLERGLINFNEPWSFEIIERDAKDFAELAIEDLLIWFQNLLNLQKIEFREPVINIKKVNSREEFTVDKEAIKIDFSILKRYTDEHQTHQNIIFVRNDYLDEFRCFKKVATIESYDHFKVSTCEQKIKYKLEIEEESSDKESLRFLLYNIFLQNNEGLDFNTCEFRDGQLDIIVNALSRNDTLGLLPTGTGKSVCYQLAAILQPAVSFVVCPIKALMYDQKADLDSAFFSRTNHITSDDDSETRERTMKEFGEGKYIFIFISPERFQIKTFRQSLKQVNKTFTIAYAVIDEVHCLSEWGHSFRLAYLNLVNTIQNHCSDFNFLALTATASLNVLKDIQVELSIRKKDVKTLEDYTRRELEFIIEDDNGDKYGTVCRLLQPLIEQSIKTQERKKNQTKCGIIFTPIVDSNIRNKGCYELSQDLSKTFKTDIKFFSGKSPQKTIKKSGKKQKVDIYPKREDFDKRKKETQTGFKDNKFSWLVATKSFGMGMNKNNIHYTIHYGIPMSIEALYQEAGRAGRDKEKFADGKEKAQCFVLLTKSANEQVLGEVGRRIFEESGLWDKQTEVPRLQRLQKQVKGDLNTNFFLLLLNQDTITEEFALTRKLHQYIIKKSGTKIIQIKSNQIEYKIKQDAKPTKAKTEQVEKAIYRLAQLGFVKDWTINYDYDNKNPEFEISIDDNNEQSVKKHLMETIRKYENKSFEEVDKEHKENFKKLLQFTQEREDTITNKCIFYLLQWTYNNFAYTRRQSLKDLYENCLDVVEGRKDKDQFKSAIEYYFRITPLSRNLQRIAESPTLTIECLEVFYQIEGGSVTETFIDRQEQENMKSALSRPLESYRDNTGLDMISGLLRLLLDDYDNADGRIRLESALKKVGSYENSDIIIHRILEIGSQMEDNKKVLLAKSLHKCIDKPDLLNSLTQRWGNTFTRLMIEQAKRELLSIKENLNDRFRETG